MPYIHARSSQINVTTPISQSKSSTLLVDSSDGNNVFIGSNSVLIAPVNLADNAFVAAGSAINNDVPSDNLAVARSKQRTIAGWKRPTKKH